MTFHRKFTFFLPSKARRLKVPPVLGRLLPSDAPVHVRVRASSHVRPSNAHINEDEESDQRQM